MFWIFLILVLIYFLIFRIVKPKKFIRMFPARIKNEWHFVIRGGASCEEEFYQELEKQLAPQVAALHLQSGYKNVAYIFNKKKLMHYAKYGKSFSLTYAEPFGTDLNITWYLYFTGMKSQPEREATAFSAICKDSAERATKIILANRQELEKPQSGSLGKA